MTKDGRLTAKNKWCYSVGGLRDVIYTFVSMFFLVYIQYTVPLTDAQFASIGVIMTLCKVWDAVNDPIMATIVENTHMKGGKFRPWILIGAITTAIVVALLFLIRIDDGWGYVAYIAIMYILWDVAFTMNDVGFWSMLPSLGKNASERNTLTTLMSVFCSVAAFAVAAVVPMFTGTDKIARYGICTVVVVSIFLASQLLTFFGVKETERDPSEGEEKITLGKMFSIIKNNDQLLWVSLVLCFYYLGSGLLLQFGMNFCYFEYGYAAGGGIYTIFAIVYVLATVISQLVFPPLAKKLSRKAIITIGAIIAALGYVVLMLFRYVLPQTIGVIITAGTLIFGGQNLINLVILVQMTNTIEYNEIKTGQRNESIVFSLRSFLAKLTSALQTLIVSLVLIGSGIKASTDQIATLEDALNKGAVDSLTVVSEAERIIAATPESASFILRVCMVAIPTVLLIICAIIDRAKYNISEAKYEEMLAELDERHNQLPAPVVEEVPAAPVSEESAE